jgi:hypothetical protein
MRCQHLVALYKGAWWRASEDFLFGAHLESQQWNCDNHKKTERITKMNRVMVRIPLRGNSVSATWSGIMKGLAVGNA